MRTLLLSLIAASLGCSEPATPDAGPDTATGPLIDHEAWVPIAAGQDLFDDRPAAVNCDRGVGWELEPLDTQQTVAMESNGCNYLALVQPALRSIAASEKFTVQLWHFELVGEGPGHAAIAIGGDVVWEKTIDIPAEAELISEEFTVANGFAPGTDVVFHLHNHGVNTWNLVDISPVSE